MSPATANAKRLAKAKRSLFGARSHVGRAIAHARTIRVSPEYRGLRWLTAAIVVLSLILAGTGILLSLAYVPDPTAAYASTRTLIGQIDAGWLVRGVHHWASDLLLAAVLAHVAVVFFRRAYAPPRVWTWVTGFFLLQLTLGFAYTGRCLPWDTWGHETARRGLDLLESVPLIGSGIAAWLRGGMELGPKSLARLYTTHILILPWATVMLLLVHGALVKRHGLLKGGPR